MNIKLVEIALGDGENNDFLFCFYLGLKKKKKVIRPSAASRKSLAFWLQKNVSKVSVLK